MTKKRNRYTRAFKLEVIHLVTQQSYKIREAAEAMGVGQSTLEGWLAQYRREQSGITPIGAKALTDEQQEIQRLRKQVKRLELEKEILKKASALLASDNLKIFR